MKGEVRSGNETSPGQCNANHHRGHLSEQDWMRRMRGTRVAEKGSSRIYFGGGGKIGVSDMRRSIESLHKKIMKSTKAGQLGEKR